MTTDKRPDLSSIEPIAPLPDDDADEQRGRADRTGFVAAATTGSTPAVGVLAEEVEQVPPDPADDDGAPQSR